MFSFKIEKNFQNSEANEKISTIRKVENLK